MPAESNRPTEDAQPTSGSALAYLLEWDGDRLRPIWFSSSFKALTGHDPPEALRDAEWWARHIHAEDGHGRLFYTCLLETGQQSAIYRFRHRDGHYFWVHDSIESVSSQDPGDRRLFSGIVTAISTERAALTTSQQRLNDFLEVASDWMWETDSQHRFTWCSDNMPLRPMGKTRWEVSNTTQDPDAWRSHRDDLDHHRPFRDFEYQIQYDADYIGWVSVSGKPLFDADGNFLGYRGTGRDITARRIADQKLAESQGLTQRLLENTQEGYWRVDNDQVTVDVNRAMCRILGRSREEIIGHVSYDFVAPDTKKSHQGVHRKRLGGQQSTYEMHLIRPDGSRVICLNNGSPVYDHNGEIIGSAGFLTDITAMKETQSRLEAARQEAEQASRAKSLFLNSMSHELRTPLNAIMGFSELLEMNFNGNLTADDLQSLAAIRESANILLTAVSRIMDMTSIETGKFNLTLAAIRPVEAVDRAVADYRGLARRNEVSVQWDPAPLADVLLLADLDRLGQIIGLLLDNAIRYNSQGGRVVIDGIPLDDGRFRLRVIDNGPGISDTKGLFDMFVRLGREAGQLEGTGLGLCMARALTQAMGGEIGYETETGLGSTFWVDLPRAADTDT